MARKLTGIQIKSSTPGAYSDGDGLFLKVDKKLNRKWIFRFKLRGRPRRDMGFGTWPDTSLQEAREKAQDARRLVAKGVDPIEERKASIRPTEAVPTFKAIAKHVIAEAQARTVSEKVGFQWELHLGESYCKALHPRPVNEIKTRDVFDVLNPVLKKKPETGRKLHRAIRKVFDHARVVLRDQHGIELGQNPADKRDLQALGLIEPAKLTRGGHPSLPYPQAPAFMGELTKIQAVSALGLKLLIMTGVRTKSVLHAEWTEFDLKEKIWTIPRCNLKDGKHRTESFRVPLADPAIDILNKLKELQQDQFVMPSMRKGFTCSNGIFLALVKRMNTGGVRWLDPKRKVRISPHGFRKTFRTWAEEQTKYPWDVREECIGHMVGNSVQRAYRDTDGIDNRRPLMLAWADYLMGK